MEDHCVQNGNESYSDQQQALERHLRGEADKHSVGGKGNFV